ncbi:MAG: hypothetical protein QM483_08845 [Desulfuromusa sp.]
MGEEIHYPVVKTTVNTVTKVFRWLKPPAARPSPFGEINYGVYDPDRGRVIEPVVLTTGCETPRILALKGRH